MSEQQDHKAHRASQSGKKAEKKDVAQGKDKTGGHKGFNEKASPPKVRSHYLLMLITISRTRLLPRLLFVPPISKHVERQNLVNSVYMYL